MAVSQYIGSRYVPLFADPIEWSSQNTYEPLTIVLYEGNSFTSKQAVPKGIDISNEDFWALTGNYDAQIELYRRETERVSDALPISEFEDTTVYESIEETKTYVDTTVSETIDTVNASIESAKQEVQSDLAAAEARIDESIEQSEDRVNKKVDKSEYHVRTFPLCAQSYLGRYFKDTNHGVQGATMIDDAIGLFAMPTAGANDNNVLIARINIKTGEVVNEYTCEFGHCNSMCFNASNNKVYVVPNELYSSGSTIKTSQMYVCNPYTLIVEKTITLPNVGLSATYDFAKNEMYVACETTFEGSYAVELYKFNFIGETFDRIGIIPHNPKYIPFANGRSLGTDGAQGCEVYDGNAYFLIGGHINTLVEFDLSTLAPTGLIEIDPNCFIYTLSEAQAACFTPTGNIIMSSLARNCANQIVNLITALHYSGETFGSFDNYAPRNTYLQYVDCDGTIPLNGNIYQTGAEGNKFSSLGDAISLSIMQGVPVRIFNTCYFEKIPRTDFSPNCLRFVAGNDPATIAFKQNFYPHAPLFFDGTSGTRRLTIKSGYEEVKSILFTSYKMSVFRYVEFDCENMQNYILRLNGFIFLDNCTAINTENMYTTIIDAQNRGNGFIVASSGITLHEPAPIQS